MSLQQSIERYVAVASGILPQYYTAARCLNATRVTCDVFMMLGIRARPVSVQTIVENAAWKLDPNGHDAHSLLVDIHGGAPDLTGWPGHLVAVIAERFMVDSATAQFRRPGLLDAPEVFAGVLSKEVAHGKKSVEYELAPGTFARYRVRRSDRTFLRMPGFRNPYNHSVAREIVAELRGAHG